MAMKVIGHQSGDPASAVASSSAQTAITDVHPSANGRLQNSLCLQTTFPLCRPSVSRSKACQQAQ